MFENLSDKLDRAFKLLKGQGKISEINIAETLKEVRKALLDADVNYKVAKQFTDTVKEKGARPGCIDQCFARSADGKNCSRGAYSFNGWRCYRHQSEGFTEYYPDVGSSGFW